MDDHLNFTQPIEAQFAHDGLETAIATAVKQVFAENLANQMQDLVDYGSPHIGSATVVERFTKQDGLAVLRRNGMSDTFMRKMYENWLSIASERGLGFLEFVLKMMWGGDTQVVRLWHSVAHITSYPDMVVEQQQAGYFLTSRIKILLGKSINLNEAIELAPILKRLVPAHILPNLYPDALKADLVLGNENGDGLGVAIGFKPYLIADLSDGQH